MFQLCLRDRDVSLLHSKFQYYVTGFKFVWHFHEVQGILGI